ncbi:hypothetical protein AMS68_003357 [Peltaster fructicola]|uniref:Borealin N-terminal domain-containing protein n=1 Tax=Peltaster fructicola TaxID=286661 RepID=A0A6H0XTQ6_9PEZI|nr:hypothetical protein AMS68_003357 [Peltaster fructicola]
MSLFPMPPKAQSTPVQATTRGDETESLQLTAVEKQAMVDDLQLEITKRARGLRSIYNEQARQLRESLERRVHRIPPRMRSKTMGELADEQAKKASKPTVPPKVTAPARSAKRTSNIAFEAEDKENAPTAYPDLQPQKKRTKTAEPRARSAMEKSTTTTSPMKSVLSPRSHNSRTLPSKITSPEKPSRLAVPQQKSRPVSRVASRQGTTAAKKTATRKASAQEESEGRDSEGSTTSAKTTIVKRAEPTKRTVTKKAAPKATTTSTTRKRAPAAKAEPTVPTATRTLRKRG